MSSSAPTGALAPWYSAASHCADWLTAQEQLEAQVARRWVPAEAKPRRSSKTFLKYFLGLGLPLAAGAGILLLLVMPKPPTETAKGGPALMEIARLSAGVLSWLSPTDNLIPNDSIRFFIHRNDLGDRYVMIGSVDGSQQLTHFYPADANGCSVLLPAAEEAIEGRILIDEVPGPERIVVLVSHQPLCWPIVSESVRHYALGDPPAGELLSENVHATRLVFPKQPGADR
jgi:hypothetical protein